MHCPQYGVYGRDHLRISWGIGSETSVPEAVPCAWNVFSVPLNIFSSHCKSWSYILSKVVICHIKPAMPRKALLLNIKWTFVWSFVGWFAIITLITLEIILITLSYKWWVAGIVNMFVGSFQEHFYVRIWVLACRGSKSHIRVCRPLFWKGASCHMWSTSLMEACWP